MSIFRRRADDDTLTFAEQDQLDELRELHVPDPVRIDIRSDEPVDWLLLQGQAELLRRSRHKVDQVKTARAMLDADEPDTERAAIALRASRNSDPIERSVGMRPGDWTGKRVRCSSCGRSWEATIADPYFGGSTTRNGLCSTCVLTGPPVLHGTIVDKTARVRGRKTKEVTDGD